MLMEASENTHTVPMNERIDSALDAIDRTLEEYDHQRVVQEIKWADLREQIDAGDITEAEADRTYIAWFNSRPT